MKRRARRSNRCPVGLGGAPKQPIGRLYSPTSTVTSTTTPGSARDAARARSTPAPRPRPGTRRGATRRGCRGRRRLRRWKPARCGRRRWWRGTSWPWAWAWAWPRNPPSTSGHESRRIAASDGSVDARQRSVGRRIAGITHTNTIITVYKDGGEPEKGTETPWDGQTSRCHDGKDAPVDDNRNEAARRRSSSRGFSRRRIRPPKPLGSINKSEPRKYPPNADGKWTNPMHVANPKSTRGNRSIVASCEPIKTASVPYPVPLASTPTPTPLPTRRDFTLSH